MAAAALLFYLHRRDESGDARHARQNRDWYAEVAAARARDVPVIKGGGLTIPRAVWDEAWLAYAEKHHPDERQFYRILNEGFYVSELDDLRPGWRPVAREIQELRQKLLAQELSVYAYGS